MQLEKSTSLDKEWLDRIFEQGHISLPLSPSSHTSCTLYREDYQSLLPKRWLRSEAINAVLRIVVEEYLCQIGKVYASKGIIAEQLHREYVKVADAFVVTLLMTNEDEVVLQTLAPLGLLSANTKCLLLPVNTQNAKGSHWVLGCLINGRFEDKHQKSQLVMFDSGHGSGAVGSLLGARLANLYKILEGEAGEVEVFSAGNILYQNNSYDCGIFTVGFAEYVLKELVCQLDEGGPLHLDRLATQFKYLLGNSGMARDRYRGMLEGQLVKLK